MLRSRCISASRPRPWSPSGSATGQRTTGNGGQQREPTGKRFGSTKPNGNCRERLRGTCHAEGRGFESLHPLSKGPGNGAFALPDANTDSRSATGAATGTPRGSEHRPLRCRSCRSSTDRVRRGHNQGSRRDLCRAYPSGGIPGCDTPRRLHRPRGLRVTRTDSSTSSRQPSRRTQSCRTGGRNGRSALRATTATRYNAPSRLASSSRRLFCDFAVKKVATAAVWK